MWGGWVGHEVYLFRLDCRSSQTSLSLLAKSIISKRTVIFTPILSSALFLDSSL